MQFDQLIQGTLLKRYKRFLADVQLENGDIVTAHCPNTGAMTGCAEPGWKVWLSPSNNPKRKLAYTWELVQNDLQHFIGINTNKANAIVAEALADKSIPELSNYDCVKSEVKYGDEGSRIDFLLTQQDFPDCYVEVKSVTLLENNNGFFPDAKTARGIKHLREMTKMLLLGHRAVLLFCVQHTGIQTVSAAAHIDNEYAQTLSEAMTKGLEVLCYNTQITPEKIHINQLLPFKC